MKKDSRTGEIILNVVNMGDKTAPAVVDLNGKQIGSGIWYQLTAASGDAENSITDTHNVFPTEKAIEGFCGKTSVEIPAFSLNILRFKNK